MIFINFLVILTLCSAKDSFFSLTTFTILLLTIYLIWLEIILIFKILFKKDLKGWVSKQNNKSL